MPQSEPLGEAHLSPVLNYASHMVLMRCSLAGHSAAMNSGADCAQSLDEKEPNVELVAEWREQGGEYRTWPGNSGGTQAASGPDTECSQLLVERMVRREQAAIQAQELGHGLDVSDRRHAGTGS